MHNILWLYIVFAFQNGWKNILAGYFVVILTANYIRKQFKLHRLIANAFIPNPENKPFINHINSIRNDNAISNIEWCTASENIMHASSSGYAVSKKGEFSPYCKLTNNQVLEIKHRLKNGETGTSLSIFYNVSMAAISNIKSKRTWSHLNN